MTKNWIFKILNGPSEKSDGFSAHMKIDEALDEVFEEYGFENRMRLLNQAIEENEYLNLTIHDTNKS